MELVVEGEIFEVVELLPGEYSFRWLTGPNRGYGFYSSSNTKTVMDRSEMEAAVRGFLSQISPETGYIE